MTTLGLVCVHGCKFIVHRSQPARVLDGIFKGDIISLRIVNL
jgi:hypothetical protein